MGVIEIVPSTPAEPSAAGIGGVWAKARQGIRPSSARDRIATLLMWRSLNNCAPSRKPWNVLLSHDSGENAIFQNIKEVPGTVPRSAEISFRGYRASTPRLGNAARINLFVRAIVPIPGSPGSPDSASISRGLFRFVRRLGATSEDRRSNVAISAGGFSLK